MNSNYSARKFICPNPECSREMALTLQELEKLVFVCPYCKAEGSVDAKFEYSETSRSGHAAVRAFYRALASSMTMAQNYDALTKRFIFGYDPAKVVAFAEQSGFQFSKSHLEHVRLTNRKSGARKHEGVGDVVDYSPTAAPRSPDDLDLFREWHKREPG